ncbi:hypothetical protein TNCT_306331 [Trichonephila clavata]|uniref:Uncharacterized protein n=1 Tax=Trichonephila clavata TaxID=2740835 RepID=A0A8X6FXF1_TRICU|nr:hypothetical protein TNCT_306331 [Trichonephila clavata]
MDKGEGEGETNRSNDEGSRKAQGEAEVKEVPGGEESIKVELLQAKRRRSGGSSSTLSKEEQKWCVSSRVKRRREADPRDASPREADCAEESTTFFAAGGQGTKETSPDEAAFIEVSATATLLQDDRMRQAQKSPKFKKRSASHSLQPCPRTKRRPSRSSNQEREIQRSRAGVTKRHVLPGRTSLYPLRSREEARMQGEDIATTSRGNRSKPYVRRRRESITAGYALKEEWRFVLEQFGKRASQRSVSVEGLSGDSTGSP